MFVCLSRVVSGFVPKIHVVFHSQTAKGPITRKSMIAQRRRREAPDKPISQSTQSKQHPQNNLIKPTFSCFKVHLHITSRQTQSLLIVCLLVCLFVSLRGVPYFFSLSSAQSSKQSTVSAHPLYFRASTKPFTLSRQSE
jgi:hypothetical protein